MSSSVSGTFRNGIAEGEVDPTFGPLEAMRLTVMTDSPVWVILSEVRLGWNQIRFRSKPDQNQIKTRLKPD